MFPHTWFQLGDWPVTAYQASHALAVVVFVALLRARSGGGGRLLALALGGAWTGSWIGVAWARGDWLASGQSSLGALLGTLLGAVLEARPRGARMGAALDHVVPALAAADGVARLGCLASGCCHGRPAWHGPWAVVYPPESACRQPGLPLHPLPAYLALLGLGLAGGLLVLERWEARRGRPLLPAGGRCAAFLVLYGAVRFALEYLRSGVSPGVWRPGPHQWACLGLLLLGTTMLVRGRRGAGDRSRPGTWSMAA